MFKIIKKKFNLFNQKYKLDANSLKFIKHNSKIINFDNNKKKPQIALFEFTNYKSLIVAYSYFAQVFEKNYNCEMFTYDLFNKNLFIKFINKILKPVRVKEHQSFGVEKNINPSIKSLFNKRAIYIYENNIKRLKEKKYLATLKVDNILIGDLLYDSYLKHYQLPTLNINEINFKKYTIKFIENFLFWKNYIQNNDVRFIICHHTVYESAIPIRIGVKKKNCKCFQVTSESVFQLNKKNIFSYKQFEVFNYKKKFKTKSKKEQILLRQVSKKRINLRFKGVVGVDMGYSTKSSYGSKIYKKEIIKKSDKIKILIAPHDFLDNPHFYNGNIFADFYEWMNFLGKFSNNNKYDWYVKCHPDYRIKSLKILKSFLIKYPQIKFIPPATSHHQIIKEGIDFVFTMYGTIGWEYPFLGIQCVNASYFNPRYKYNFNINPRNFKEYDFIINNLKKFMKKINPSQKNEILEFYYMNYIYYKNTTNWLTDTDRMREKLGGFRFRKYSHTKSQFYNYFIKNFDLKYHKKIILGLTKFIKSKKYFYMPSYSSKGNNKKRLL